MTRVRTRFAFTVGANITRSALAFSSGMLLARWLGPTTFGKMAFLLGTFMAIRQLLDMGSSTAFFTFMSQRLRTRRFVDAFLMWMAVQLLVPALVIGLLLPPQWISAIWHGESRLLVLLAFLAVFMQNSLWPVIQQAGESQRKTLWVQGMGIAIAATHLLAVSLLWWFGALGLVFIFIAVAAEHAVAVTLVRRSLGFAPAESPPAAGEEGGLLRMYARYCLPLAPYAWVGFAYEFADRWLLQTFGGSEQQAFYAVSAQFAGIALIATGSILNIFWKEIAEAHHRGDRARTGLLYQRVTRLLFLVGAIIAGYLLPWCEELLRLLVGEAYRGGALTLALMFLYPVHQSMGQIGDTMLYATERVRIQVTVGIVFMLASIVVTWSLLAPQIGPFHGPELGSVGVAAKMLVLQFIRVNVVMFMISTIFGWRFDFFWQIVSLAGCVSLGWLARLCTKFLLPDSSPVLVSLLFDGVVYTALIAGFLALVPTLTGMSRAVLSGEIRAFLRHTLGSSK